MQGAREFELDAQGLSIIGVDEVGRGCLAGPVFAACVALSYQDLRRMKPEDRTYIKDSKKLSADKRAIASRIIADVAIESYIGMASVKEIEDLGIVHANFKAMRRALSMVRKPYDIVLVDGRELITGYYHKQEAIIGGDQSCYAIAAASILAKQARDRFMQEQAEIYPQYGFDRHVGYGTEQHRAMIQEHGICPLHRRNFAPIRGMVEMAALQIAGQS